MLLTALVLAAAMGPQADTVKSADLPAASSGVSEAALHAGFAHFKKRRFAAAETDFKRAMEADPASAGPYFYLGYTYYKIAEKKRPFHPEKQKAAELFAKAFSIDPAFRPVWGEPRTATR